MGLTALLPAGGDAARAAGATPRVIAGTKPPGAHVGRPGDFYVDTVTHQLFGPKLRAARGHNGWGRALNLVALTGPAGLRGPAGEPGPTGATGAPGAPPEYSVLAGIGPPSSSLGASGDFYIDAASAQIYGPRVNGVWGSPSGITGPIAGRPGGLATLDGTGVLNDDQIPSSVVTGAHHSQDAGENIAIGSPYTALSGGERNTALGVGALAGVTSGLDNVAVGPGALATLERGEGNIAIGFKALHSIEGSASDNIAIGTETLSLADQQSNYNVAIGHQVMSQLKGDGISQRGERNAGVGYWALALLTSGSRNTALGYIALNNLTIGNQNTAVGSEAMFRLRTGKENTSIGEGSLELIEDGSLNTAAGKDCLLRLTTDSSWNTALGSRIGERLEHGHGNVMIGFHVGPTGPSLASLDNQLFIGSGPGPTPLIWGNFGSPPGRGIFTATLVEGSPLMTEVSSFAGLKKGTYLEGPGFGPAGVEVHSVDENTNTLEMYALGAAAPATADVDKGVFRWEAPTEQREEEDRTGPNGDTYLGRELQFNTEKISLFAGVAPVSRAAGFAEVPTTPPTAGGYGFTKAQAEEILAAVNQLRAMNKAIGIME